MKKGLFVLLALAAFQLLSVNLVAQNVAINTDGSNADQSAILDVKSNSKGMLVPRMTTAQRTGIGSPAAGLLVYDTDTNNFWFYNGAGWTQLTTSGSSNNQWTTTGNNISNNNSGNVGIGMLASPSAKLSIGGGLNIFSGTTQAGSINPNGDNTIVNARLGSTLGGTPSGNLILQNTNSSTGFAGRIGIGNDAPEQKLHLTGNALFDAADPFLRFRNGSTGSQNGLVGLTDANMQVGTGSGNSTGRLNFTINGTTRAGIDALGNVGIGGAFTPAATLHVNGTFRLNNGNEGANKILVSDAGGNASWQDRNIYFLTTINNQTLSNASTIFGNYDILFATASGPNPYFTNNVFTAPVAGFYHFDLNLDVSLNVGLVENVYAQIANISTNTIISSSSYVVDIDQELGYGVPVILTGNAFLQAGEQIVAKLRGNCDGNTPLRILNSGSTIDRYTFSGFKVF